VRLYVVWLSMVRSDSKRGWQADLLTDPRAVHFWDEDKEVGAWFGKRVGYTKNDGVLWDAFFLYGPDAAWGDPPGPLVVWGRPVIEDREELEKGLRTLLGQPAQREGTPSR
jgi:hypothetical protein